MKLLGSRLGLNENEDGRFETSGDQIFDRLKLALLGRVQQPLLDRVGGPVALADGHGHLAGKHGLVRILVRYRCH